MDQRLLESFLAVADAGGVSAAAVRLNMTQPPLSRQIKLLGGYHRVRARVVSVDLSSHADQDDLVDWIATATPPPEMVFVNHGESDGSAALVDVLDDRLGLDAVVPRAGERVRLAR